ncbi:MAG: lasso RiPP family leader peptide-containing protein [Actinomycetota bacterium]|nr:lasso RiPP family leader peptide-containing protein [Actinomycetota bacterium]
MYAAPQLTDLGSFQELTLSPTGGVIGPIGSLVSSTLSDVNHLVHQVTGQLPGVQVDDNSHIGTSGPIVIAPKITITPR